MTDSETPISAASLLEALRANVPTSAEHLRHDVYELAFGKRADEVSAEGRDDLAAAFRLLGLLTSLRLMPDDPELPLQPLFIREESRSFALDDLSDEQLQAVAEVAAEATDPELRARLADVVWIRKRNYQLAQVAVVAYSESGQRLLDGPLTSRFMERYERAIQIAASLGKSHPLFEQTLKAVEAIADDPDKFAFAVAESLDLVVQYSDDNLEHFAQVAESRATNDDSKGKPLWQRRFWELAARLYRRAKKDEDMRRARIEIAKTFEREAEEALARDTTPKFLKAAHFLESAMQAYRRVSGTEADRNRVHRQLVECQQQAVKEFQTLTSGPVELTEAIERSKQAVRGKPFAESLQTLALSCRSPNILQLRAEAGANIDRHPLAFMFAGSILSSSGKVVARQDAADGRSAEDREQLIRQQMWSAGRLHRTFFVAGMIRPMRQQILTDHFVRYDDFWPLVGYNPLVPIGREHFFIRGLHAGLQGNFVDALHILVPQFEHSIRCLLFQKGVIVSSLDHRGIQKEYDLNETLRHPRLTEILSEDIIFDLRGSLVEQAGSNFRNLLAHGLLEYGAFFSETAEYIWWLILRLCFLATMTGQGQSEAPSGGAAAT